MMINMKNLLQHAQSVLHTTDWYLPKSGLVAMTGGMLTGAMAHEAELRVVGLIITIVVGITVIAINIPKAMKAWRDWFFPNDKCEVDDE